MENNGIANGEKLGIKPKMKIAGKVVKIGLAGAVIEIDAGKHAILHIAQIKSPQNEPVKRVEDVLEIGQQLDLFVHRIRGEQIELTMFKPLDLEWREIKPGMTVTGKVVRIEKFGAFVEIGAERPGLVHISELAHGYVQTPNDVVKEGQEIEAAVLEVNRRKKQIKLSMKALQPSPEEAAVLAQEDDDAEFSPKRKPARSKKSSKTKQKVEEEIEEEVSETDTALGFALREAMEQADKQETPKQAKPKKKAVKQAKLEQEDIISRTLEQRPDSE